MKFLHSAVDHLFSDAQESFNTIVQAQTSDVCERWIVMFVNGCDVCKRNRRGGGGDLPSPPVPTMETMNPVPDGEGVTARVPLTLPHQVTAIFHQELISLVPSYLPVKPSRITDRLLSV